MLAGTKLGTHVRKVHEMRSCVTLKKACEDIYALKLVLAVITQLAALAGLQRMKKYHVDRLYSSHAFENHAGP